MKTIHLTMKEKQRVAALKKALKREITVPEVAELLGLSERETPNVCEGKDFSIFHDLKASHFNPHRRAAYHYVIVGHYNSCASAEDWNCDGSINRHVGADINNDPSEHSNTRSILTSYNDWDNLKFGFQDSCEKNDFQNVLE